MYLPSLQDQRYHLSLSKNGNLLESPLSSQSGIISSTQNGPDGKPEWKVSGTWKFTNLSSNSPAFNVSFDMMKLDGSSKHHHTIDATINSAEYLIIKAGKSSIRAYSGTAAISMKEGPVSDVPIVIRLSGDGNISIQDTKSFWKHSDSG